MSLRDSEGINTFYHHAGSGKPVVMIHGSGPGVSAWANWRLVLPEVSQHFAAYALDVIGFGKTDKPADCAFTHKDWQRCGAISRAWRKCVA